MSLPYTTIVGRRALLAIALTQLVMSLVIPVASSFALAFGKLYLLDTYVELTQNGVINKERLGQVRGGHFTEYWQLPDDLGDHFDRVRDIGLAMSVLLMAFSAAIMVIWWLQRRQEHKMVCESSKKSGIEGPPTTAAPYEHENELRGRS